MKTRVLFLLASALMISYSSFSQRGVRIGYIDTQYILENVPEYQEATAQLDSKVQSWKSEIEKKLNEVEQKKRDLNNESVLLTNELIKEREEDIKFEEDEILEYQQKRFGPNGDLVVQKKQLIQPIQDQIFAAVQDIAKNKQYDFVFDKSADVVMLYSAERYDISELVLRSITRSSKRKQLETRKQRKEAEDEDVVPEINQELEDREKAIQEKRSAREKAAEERRQQILEEREAKKKAAEERRQKILEEREAARAAKLGQTKESEPTEKKEDVENDNSKEPGESSAKTQSEGEDANAKTQEELLEERKQQKLDEREARRQALEERRQKILEQREKARKERLEQLEEQKRKKENQTDGNQED